MVGGGAVGRCAKKVLGVRAFFAASLLHDGEEEPHARADKQTEAVVQGAVLVTGSVSVGVGVIVFGCVHWAHGSLVPGAPTPAAGPRYRHRGARRPAAAADLFPRLHGRSRAHALQPSDDRPRWVNHWATVRRPRLVAAAGTREDRSRHSGSPLAPTATIRSYLR